MKKTIPFLVLLGIVLIGFTVFFGLYEVKFFSSRASVTREEFSIDNSYMFITPLAASANGQEKIRLTVFILNSQGLGVAGRNLFVSPDPNLKIDIIQGVTDDYGKAYFDISSNMPGEYDLEVKADDKALKQKAHLVFR